MNTWIYTSGVGYCTYGIHIYRFILLSDALDYHMYPAHTYPGLSCNALSLLGNGVCESHDGKAECKKCFQARVIVIVLAKRLVRGRMVKETKEGERERQRQGLVLTLLAVAPTSINLEGGQTDGRNWACLIRAELYGMADGTIGMRN